MRARSAFGLAFVLLMGAAATASGQTAADKATARNLASEGIELYQAGKHQEALDRLERAQALYDAPVHLLYIARAQAAQDRLVEAAETYRRLVRVKLEADAPEAFQQAIAQGEKELAELEPAVPALRVEVTPATAQDLELSIDGEPVSAAVVGADRPINPGEHTVRVAAAGHVPSEQKVTIARGEKKTVALTLTESEAEPRALPADEAKAGSEPGASKLGLFLGLRLFGAVPAGTAGVTQPANNEVSMSDVMQTGGGLELQGGLRFAHYFAGKLYADFFSMQAGDGVADDAQVSGFETGVGFHVGTKAHQLGGFGEVGLGFVQSFQVHDESSLPNCTTDATWRGGPSFRIGGGAVIPLSKYFQLTPFMLANFAQFNHLKVEARCEGVADPISFDGDIPEDDRAGHQLFLLGLGADWLIGG